MPQDDAALALNVVELGPSDELSVGLAGVSVLGAFLASGELFIGGVIALALTHFAIFTPRATEFEP